MTPLIYFVRHGQTPWNAEQRLQGQADIDINAVGREQADRNGRRLAELIPDPAVFDFVASPMRRTRETMERARAAMGLATGRVLPSPSLKRANLASAVRGNSTNGILSRPARMQRATRCSPAASVPGCWK
jgi:broad specificity phosphatase PhoE